MNEELAMPSISELINALPQEENSSATDMPTLSGLAGGTVRPVPIGRLRRIGLLGSLQAKIAAAYAFYWIRGWFKTAEERERLAAETHWRTAAHVLDSMSYLRGAAMKAGQLLGSLPDIVPDEFVGTLEQLHADAPPMHFSLLREMVYNELGDDPENVFASFEKRAFAAASLGQVHRATLKSGAQVAVKIQYPGIGSTIRDDFANLELFMLPARLSRDWENLREQFQDVRLRLEHETDYTREAATLQAARALFREDEGIVIPRVYPEHSTERVLTMEYLQGQHLGEFLQTEPSQELRNEFARKLMRTFYRMLYCGRMIQADFNPGNFIFMEDGRLGVIDLGCVMDLDDAMWELFRKMDRPLTTGRRDERIAFMKEWVGAVDEAADAERLRVVEEAADWSWRPRYCGGEFDFGDETDLRRGIEIYGEGIRKRYTRGHPCSTMFTRHSFALRAMLYRLKARIAITPLAEQEVRAAGWDRSDYAP